MLSSGVDREGRKKADDGAAGIKPSGAQVPPTTSLGNAQGTVKTSPPAFKGEIGRKGGQVYYTDGKNVFRASPDNAVDVTSGYLIGRWECTVEHWNRFAEAVYGMEKICSAKEK